MNICKDISISELTSIKQELKDLIEEKRYDIKKRIEYEKNLQHIQKLIEKRIDNLLFD